MLPVLFLPQHDLLFVLNLVQLGLLGSSLLCQSLLEQRLLLVVFLRLATALFLEGLLEQREQLVGVRGWLSKEFNQGALPCQLLFLLGVHIERVNLFFDLL